MLIFLLVSTLLAGVWVRFSALGLEALSTHESTYHFAAQQAGASGSKADAPPATASVHGRPMVQLIRVTQQMRLVPEIAARLPSAIIGTLALLLFAALVWLVAGPWAALGATFMFAFYPEAIRQSRTAGLYSAQLFFGVVALGAGWLATSRASPHLSSTPLDLVRRWIWTGAALAAFLLAGLAHLSAGLVVGAYGVWMLLLAAAAIWIAGRSAILNNLAVQVVIVGVVGSIAMLIAKPDIIDLIVDKFTSPPSMLFDGTGGMGGRAFHIFTLASQFAWALTLLPLLVILVVRKYPWLTLYLVLWFVLPLIAGSLFIARKEERLLLIATPALFVLAGLALHEARELVARAINLHAREWLATYRSAVRVGDAVVWTLVAFALLSLPAMGIALRIPGNTSDPTALDWASLKRVFAAAPKSANLPVGSPEPLQTILYVGRSDFAMGALLGPLPGDVAAGLPVGSFPAATDSVSRERLSGAVLTQNVAELRAAYLSYGDVLVVLDSEQLWTPAIDPSISALLVERGAELCQGSCGRLRLFRLPLGAALAPTPGDPPRGG